MGGGLMQLVAYGAQDVYLTGNPQITFFKVVYRRHTNFAVEAIEQTFNGSPDFGKKASVQITRNGDLITKMYLKATLESTYTEQTVTDAAGDSVKMAVNGTATAAAAITSGAAGAADTLVFATGASNTITAAGALDFTNASYAVGNVILVASAANAGNNGYHEITAKTNTVLKN